jgi:membrane fusion protein, multidrug efflux system
MDSVQAGDPNRLTPGAAQHGATGSDAPAYRVPPTPGRGRRIFWVLFVLVIAAVLGGAAYYYEYTVKPAMMAQFFQPPPPSPVETAIAEAEDMPRAFESIGTLTAVHQVTISPQLEGRIDKVNFESGQLVKAGDVLVQFDDSTQRADLATYQAQMRLASANLVRTRELAAKQFSSKQSVDQLQSELDQARAGIAKSQAVIDQMVVKAPFDGMLGIRQINLGQYLAPGTAIVTLTDLDTLYVDFSLPEQDRAGLSIDQPVEFRVDSFPNQVFRGEISAIDPQVDPLMRAVKVRATLANSDHKLQPGMYARIRVILPPQPNVVTIPEPAVDYTVYGESVYRLTAVPDKKDPQGKPVYKVEQTFVTLGARFDGKVAVLKGIAAGDLVVVGGQLKVHNGAEVVLSEQKSLQTPLEVPKE